MERQLNIQCAYDCNPEKVAEAVDRHRPDAVNFTRVLGEAQFAMVRNCIERIADDALRYTVFTDGRELYQDTVFFFNERYVSVVLDTYTLTRFMGDYPDNPNYFELSNLHQVSAEALYEGLPFDLHSRLFWEMKLKNLKICDYAYYPKLPCASSRQWFMLPSILDQYIGEFEKHLDLCFRAMEPGAAPTPPGTRSLHVLDGFVRELAEAVAIQDGCFCNHACLRSIESTGREVLCAQCGRGADEMDALMNACRDCEYLPFCRNRCVAAVDPVRCGAFRRMFDVFLRCCRNYGHNPLDLIGRFVFRPAVATEPAGTEGAETEAAGTEAAGTDKSRQDGNGGAL